MENRTIYAAILGLGTVGTGTWKVLQAQKEEMQHKLGAVIEVKKILVRNTAKAAAKTGLPELVTDDWEEIVKDDSIEIVIELMGGLEPAKNIHPGGTRSWKACGDGKQRSDRIRSRTPAGSGEAKGLRLDV